MTHFLRHAFDPGLLQPLQQAFTQQIAPQLSPAMLAGGRQWQAHLPKVPFDVFSYNQAPLLWVSGALPASPFGVAGVRPGGEVLWSTLRAYERYKNKGWVIQSIIVD